PTTPAPPPPDPPTPPYTTLFRSLPPPAPPAPTPPTRRPRARPPHRSRRKIVLGGVAALGLIGTLTLVWQRREAESRSEQRPGGRSEEHTSELQSRFDLVCRLLLE